MFKRSMSQNSVKYRCSFLKTSHKVSHNDIKFPICWPLSHLGHGNLERFESRSFSFLFKFLSWRYTPSTHKLHQFRGLYIYTWINKAIWMDGYTFSRTEKEKEVLLPLFKTEYEHTKQRAQQMKTTTTKKHNFSTFLSLFHGNFSALKENGRKNKTLSQQS